MNPEHNLYKRGKLAYDTYCYCVDNFALFADRDAEFHELPRKIQLAWIFTALQMDTDEDETKDLFKDPKKQNNDFVATMGPLAL